MSLRTIVEINHDKTPTEEELSDWAWAMKLYLQSGDPKVLPGGVTWFNTRHHSDDCPMGQPPHGWDNSN